jgi:GTP cyclohydrolase I
MKKSITWKEFKDLVEILAIIIKESGEKFDAIFGIPRGGCFVALELSKILNIPITNELKQGVLIVDDIVDSGGTISKFNDKYVVASLYYKPKAKTKPVYKAITTEDWIVFPWETKEDTITDNITRILEYIGEDPNRDGLKDTPERIKRSYDELFKGYKISPKEVLSRRFEATYDEMVVLKDIEFYSFCEHHMLPFFGKISIAYIPSNKVVGISKLARLVEVYARRLQIQERLTEQIAETIYKELNAKGVGVYVEAQHFCMVARGIQKKNSKMVTSKLIGAMMEKPEARAEFLRLIE